MAKKALIDAIIKPKHKWLYALVLAAIGIFWFSTMRIGTSWGDDWAMFVHHAKNIAEGHAYDDTKYLVNPHYLSYAPQTYPPGFPVLLAPVYAVWGINYTALKAPGIICFLLALLVLLVYYRQSFSMLTTLLIVIGLGLNPYLWDFKDSILSDFPFLLFTVLSGLIITRYLHYQDKPYRFSILLGVCIFCAYSIRTLGILFLPALLLNDIITKRKISSEFVITAVTCSFLVAFQFIIMPHDSSYFKILLAGYKGMGRGDITNFIANNFYSYWQSLADFFLIQNRPEHLIKYVSIVSGIVWCFAIIGYATRLIKENIALELFVMLYLIVVLIYPGFQGSRYLIPVLPFLLMYFFQFIQLIVKGFARNFVIVAFTLITIFFYKEAYKYAEWKNTTWGIHEKPAQQLFTYIVNNTPKQAVFVNAKPRALGLFIDRTCVIYYSPENKAELLDYLKNIHDDYVVSGIVDEGDFPGWVEKDTANFNMVYKNEYFKLYKAHFK